MNLMNQKQFYSFVALTVLLSLGACNEESKEPASTESAPAVAASKPAIAAIATATGTGSTSPGKPSAPISMQYEILGNPIVGQPVAINVQVRSTSGNQPVTVQYSINDSSALVFQAGQVESLQFTANAEKKADSQQQLAVIPQREGRLYVNVSAEIQTPDGSMIKSMAIPIQVGSAPEKPEINGELVEGPDGETVISMPAKEN